MRYWTMILMAGFFLLSFMPVFTLYQPVDLAGQLSAPSLQHPMGTDELGRDVFTRVVRGFGLSVRVSIAAWLAALGLGLLAGSLAGYFFNSVFDRLTSWMISLAYMLPFMLFLIALLGVVGPGLENAYLVLVLLAWVPSARQSRVAVIGLRDSGPVTAGRSFGYDPTRMVFYILWPQVFRPVFIASLAVLPEIIALDAGLSFLGLGAQPPTPTLGKMIADGLPYLELAPWMAVFPTAVLVGICLITRFILKRTLAV